MRRYSVARRNAGKPISRCTWSLLAVPSTFNVSPPRARSCGIAEPPAPCDREHAADLLAEYKFNPDLALKLNLTNVTNTLYADALYTGHYTPGTGRLVQLSLNAKF